MLGEYYIILQILVLFDISCGCKTWSFSLTEEHALKLFKMEVLRRVFGRVTHAHVNKIYLLLTGALKMRAQMSC
jgi:hypothetical protein